ncbi:RNA guanine-N7 methyltransferase activating subunit-like [Littorina saxatilis]|uniref:Uncharacterized protein n=1 Tax=Littorina saxatilis TaxID=31220 RepID=A0AAN9B1S3_9CAEN
MATSEIEDLAALVGIEILPDKCGETEADGTESQPSITPVCPTTSETELNEASAGPAFSADVLAMCSSERLTDLEEEFADRYTQRDTEFTKTLATPTLPPPCVSPWWSNDRGDRFRGRGGQGGGRGRGGSGGHHDRRGDRDRGDYHQQRSYGRHDNRHEGQGHQGNYRDREHHQERQHGHYDHRGQGHQRGGRDRRDDYREREHRQHRDRSPDRRNRY